MSLLPLAAAGEQSPYGMMGMFAIFFGIMYFLMIRPQRRKEKERKEMIATLKSGCRVMMSSGIIGQVTNVKEHTLIGIQLTAQYNLVLGPHNKRKENDQK